MINTRMDVDSSMYAFMKILYKCVTQRENEVDIKGLRLMSSRLMLPAEPGD